MTIETFNFLDVQASSHCSLPKLKCVSKYIVNNWSIDKNFFYLVYLGLFVWRKSRESIKKRLSHYKDHFTEHDMGNMQLPMNIDDLPFIEKPNPGVNLNIF